MAVDMEIEVFSVDVYRTIWHCIGVNDFIHPRLKKYDNVNDETTCSDSVFHAIICRRLFFRSFYVNKIVSDFEVYSKSTFDFYLYILKNMDTFLVYKNMNVFDKLFMICAVIVEMGYTCSLKSNYMYLYNCPQCFALYFDSKYKEEFYAAGGWCMLEIQAKSYQARVLTHPTNREVVSCAMTAFNDSILTHYSIDDVKMAFKRCFDGETCCPQCLPLFHAIRNLFVASESVTEYKLTEGYLQLILCMLSHKELLEKEKHFLESIKFEKIEETSQLNSDMQQKSDEAFLESLCEYKKQNTRWFLSRLFQAHDLDIDNQCMFCASNVNQLLEASNSVSDIRVERIKSAISETMKRNRKKSIINKESAFDIDTNGILKLFFALGVQPLMSNILESLKKSQLHSNVEKLADSLAKINIPKALGDKKKKKTQVK